MQLLGYFRPARDLWVLAQCPQQLNAPEYCRATGAADVLVDEPLAAINSLHESSFDVVIDTIGGRRREFLLRQVESRSDGISSSFQSTTPLDESCTSMVPSSLLLATLHLLPILLPRRQ